MKTVSDNTTIAQHNNDCSVIVILAHCHVLGFSVYVQEKERRKLMGLLSLLAMLDGENDLESVMSWHLQFNCYPPTDPNLIPVCLEAVTLYNNAQPDEVVHLLDKELNLPEGVLYKGDKTTAPLRAIVEGFHLDGFLSTTEEEDYDIEN